MYASQTNHFKRFLEHTMYIKSKWRLTNIVQCVKKIYVSQLLRCVQIHQHLRSDDWHWVYAYIITNLLKLEQFQNNEETKGDVNFLQKQTPFVLDILIRTFQALFFKTWPNYLCTHRYFVAKQKAFQCAFSCAQPSFTYINWIGLQYWFPELTLRYIRAKRIDRLFFSINDRMNTPASS